MALKITSQSHSKKLLLVGLILSMALFLTSFTSALEFDNVQSYDPVTRTYIIENFFGLGETLAELRLNSPLNVKLAIGYQQVAEFTLNNYKSDYGNAFQDMNFYDLKIGGEEITREFDYKYLTYEDVQIPEYEIVCITKNNQTAGDYQVCQREETGWHWEERVKWIKFSDINELPPNTLTTIGIFTNVLSGDYVEWIPTFMGERLTE